MSDSLSTCSICKKIMQPDENCGGDCRQCMADSGDPDCLKSLLNESIATNANLLLKISKLQEVLLDFKISYEEDGIDGYDEGTTEHTRYKAICEALAEDE